METQLQTAQTAANELAIGRAPSSELVALTSGLPSPSLVYDLDGMRETVLAIRGDLERVPGIELNLALKACHTPAVLEHLSALGLGADVASMAEFRLAQKVGFSRLTATGPSFTPEDAGELAAAGVVLDVSSVDQLNAVGSRWPGSELGLRVRVDLPDALRIKRSTFGSNSRFGVSPLHPAVHEATQRHDLRITRLHTHTGQMTPRHFLYKLRFLLTVSEYFESVRQVNMGGGLFYLFASRDTAQAALIEAGEMVTEFEQRTGRQMQVQVEPGGAIVAPHGFIVATVLSSEHHPGFDARVVTLDASAWNLAPWHKPQVVPLTTPRPGEGLFKTYVAGNTLYENDFFGTDVYGNIGTHQLPHLESGDRVLLTASGAYTMTNSRRFHMLDLPTEYAYVAGELCQVS